MVRTSVGPGGRAAQRVIATGLIAVFGAAFIGAWSWPTETGLYPRVVSAGGIVLAVVFLVGTLFGSRTPDTAALRVEPPAKTGPADDDPAEHDADYVFAHATSHEWLAALGWVAAFFGGLIVIGLYLTVLVFTLAYLRISARAGWVLTISYAGIASGVLYVGAGLLLHVPVPDGLLW
jgi:hypothetical protein